MADAKRSSRLGRAMLATASTAAAGAVAYYAYRRASSRAPAATAATKPDPSAAGGAVHAHASLAGITASCRAWEEALHGAIRRGDNATAAKLRRVLRRAYKTVEVYSCSFAPGSESCASDSDSYVSADDTLEAEQDLTGFDLDGTLADEAGVPSTPRGPRPPATARAAADAAAAKGGLAALAAGASPLRPPPDDMWTRAMRLAEVGKVRLRHADRTRYTGGEPGVDHAARVHCFREASAVMMRSPDKASVVLDFFVRVLSGLLIKGGTDPAPFTAEVASFKEFMKAQYAADGLTAVSNELHGLGVAHVGFYDIVLDFMLFDAFTILENPPATVVAALQTRWVPQAIRERGLRAALWGAVRARGASFKAGSWMGQFYGLNVTYVPTLGAGILGVSDPEYSELCKRFIGIVKEWTSALFAMPGRGDGLTAEQYCDKILDHTRIVGPKIVEMISTAMGPA